MNDPRVQPARLGANRRQSRNGFVGSMAIAAVALSVIIVPHFIPSSPVTNHDTDPTNGVPTTSIGSMGQRP